MNQVGDEDNMRVALLWKDKQSMKVYGKSFTFPASQLHHFLRIVQKEAKALVGANPRECWVTYGPALDYDELMELEVGE